MRRYWAGGPAGLWLIQEMREDLNQPYLVSAADLFVLGGVAEMTADRFALAGVAIEFDQEEECPGQWALMWILFRFGRGAEGKFTRW